MHGLYQTMEMRHWIAFILRRFFLKVRIITYKMKEKIVSIRRKFTIWKFGWNLDAFENLTEKFCCVVYKFSKLRVMYLWTLVKIEGVNRFFKHLMVPLIKRSLEALVESKPVRSLITMRANWTEISIDVLFYPFALF